MLHVVFFLSNRCAFSVLDSLVSPLTKKMPLSTTARLGIAEYFRDLMDAYGRS